MDRRSLRQRQKLINAIIYFAQNTAHCGKIKLFKLLYLLDFQHFQETGKSVTGFDYQAWKFGPVPVKLMEEWESFGEDLLNAVHIESEKVYDFERQSVKVNPGISFDESGFTPRQLRIMKSLSEAYKDTFSPAMIDVTHAQNGAWDKVWQNGKGAFDPIPYDLAVAEDDPDRSIILEIHAEQMMRLSALKAAQE
jgi:Uncharacterized phage-associated protein